MKSPLEKLKDLLPQALRDYLRMLFSNAAENHLHIARAKEKKFRSYTQLKRYQQKVRKIAFSFMASVVLIFVGMVLAPVISPPDIKSEVYIPNGKGDVLLANVSKNQATIIFKTLDAANGNKPLATTAFVEAFEDQSYSRVASKTKFDEFAVTHIVPITGLTENKTYYLRITAKDSSNIPSLKTVTSWGDGKDPIMVYASGEVAVACVNTEQTTAPITNTVQTAAPVIRTVQNVSNTQTVETQNNTPVTLQIDGVQNESHIFSQTKVQTIISWTTTLPATTALVYREANSNQNQELKTSDAKTTKHIVVLTTLNPASTYFFKAKSVGADGAEIVSEEYSLHTPQGTTTIIQKITDSFKSVINGIAPK